MIYTVHTIVPFNLVGAFKKQEKHYTFHFIHSMPTIGHLYVYGAGSDGKITENLFVMQGIINKNFSIVFEKLNQVYDLVIRNGINPRELPSIEVKQAQYQVLISGTKQANISPFDQTRYINIYFASTFNKVVLKNGEEMDIKENNIDDFLAKLDNYNLG